MSPLRVALLVDSLTLPAWCYYVVRDIQASGFARVVLVVENAAASAPPPGGRSLAQRLRRLWAVRDQLLYHLYTKYDERRYRPVANPFEPRSIQPLIEGCPVLRVAPRATRFCDYFGEADAAAVRAHGLDVAVRFGFRILKGEALAVARYGVWSYHHGDNLVNRGGPAGFWEVAEGHPVTGSVLQVLTEELDAGRVIYRSYAATDRRSVALNRANYYWKSAAFILRKLRDLYYEGPDALRDRWVRPDAQRAYSNRLYVTPRNRELAPFLLRRLGQSVTTRMAALLAPEQWVLAYSIRAPADDGAGVPAAAMYRFRTLIPPRNRFWADPFPVQRGDRYYVFIEEFVYADGKGHISLIEMDAKGGCTAPVKVLEREYHLSYPCVFEWQGQFYMIPETHDNSTVELYRATVFPHRWELERTLLEGVRAVDATVAEVDGRWWMFVNIAPVIGASASDELHVYHAETPLGPWAPHRRNPVKSDVRSARPAGQLFRWREQLYRPAQDCSISYGHAIAINRVRRLDVHEYEEEVVSRIEPRWHPGLTGTHTLNSAGRLTVIDARLRRRRFP